MIFREVVYERRKHFLFKNFNIPYNSIFTPNFNDFSILITIISGAYLQLFVTNECVGDVTIPTQVIMYNQSYSCQISQSDCSIRIHYFIAISTEVGFTHVLNIQCMVLSF
jgi:hypothetical protein